jgi:iron complex outermembrane receptor protein
LKWTAGAFLFYQDAPVKQATRFGIDANLIMIGDSLFSIINTSTTLKKGFAIYGQATYALSDKLNMSFGLRNDYENQTLSILGEYQRDPSPELYTTTPDTLGRTNFNAFSPKLSLDYQVNNYSLWYGSYSKGFRAGGLSPLSSDPSQPPLVGYLPEYSNNFETGIKNNWLNNKLILNYLVNGFTLYYSSFLKSTGIYLLSAFFCVSLNTNSSASITKSSFNGK